MSHSDAQNSSEDRRASLTRLAWARAAIDLGVAERGADGLTFETVRWTSKQVWLLIGCLLSSPGLLTARPNPQVAGNSSGTSPSSNPPIAASARQVSWKRLVPNILQDQKPVWLFPARVAQGKHVKPTLGFVFATAGLVALDPHEAPYFRRTTSFTDFNSAVSGRNTALGTAIFPLTFYAVGLARKDSYAQRSALLAAQAIADTEILTTVMKNIDRRLRPIQIPPDGDFSHTWFKSHGPVLRGRGSFPSGHTIAAFSVATVFAQRYRQHRWAPWLAYGLASLVGFSRVTLQSHFPSDVFAGAVLGYVVSHHIVLCEP